MDFLKSLGPLAVVSRLRRLTERMTQEGIQIYKEQEVDFEPRWFPVFYLLSQNPPTCVGDVARVLGISHPAVNQIAGEMIKAGLVQALKDDADKRKRLLSLTNEAKAMLPALQQVWDRVNIAAQDLLDETGMDVLAMLDKLEEAAEQNGIYARYTATRNAQNAIEEAFSSPSEPETAQSQCEVLV